MLKKTSVTRGKKITELIDHKSHVQKRYFTLMLVPSFSAGRTRSLRIPYSVFYCIVISFLVISAIITGFYLRSNYFMRVAEGFSISLDEAQDAYLELQETSINEQNRLLDNHQQLQTQLTEEQIRYQTEKFRQRQDYQESLDVLQEQIDGLEQQLRDLDETRQELIDQLGAKAFIPPVASFLKEWNTSQDTLLASLNGVHIRSDERSDSTRASVEDLRDYFALLSAKIQTRLIGFDNLEALIKKAGPYVKNYPTRWPVKGPVSSGYGYRRNAMGGSGSEFHSGIDIRAGIGTSVYATGGGIVKEAGYSGNYGNVVVIDHGIGIKTLYAHNSKILVSVGQRVERGDVIAKSGNTGRSTGPHVHYEVIVNGSTVNPNKYFLE